MTAISMGLLTHLAYGQGTTGTRGRPVLVQSVAWEGAVTQPATRQILDEAVSEAVRKTLDKSQVQELANKLTKQLRDSGMMVAQVVVTPAGLARFERTGELSLLVFEGKVGAVRVQNSSRVKDTKIESVATQALCPDGVGDECTMTSRGLERAQLLLQDIPGVRLQPVSLSPEGVGIGQTAVGITTESSAPMFGGYAGVDNLGFPASGVYRAFAGVSLTDPLRIGDLWQMTALGTDEGQFAGSLQGSVPLGDRGLRGQAAYSHSLYSVSRVGARGSADTVSAGVSYPIVRGLDRNWTVALDGLNTNSRQSVNGISAFGPRRLSSGRISLTGDSGDRQIQLGGSYWTASTALSYGHVTQDLQVTDITGTLGNYAKWSANGTGKLNLGNGNWYLLGTMRGQLASRNLDASEKLSIGGQTGVRAYRPDEGLLDTGVAASIELRRLFSLPNGDRLAFGPLVDVASGSVNRHPYTGWQVVNGYADANLSNQRTLAGWGLGLDWVSTHGITGSLVWAGKFPGSPDSVNYPGSANSRFLASITARF